MGSVYEQVSFPLDLDMSGTADRALMAVDGGGNGEGELLLRHLAGDENAFSELVHRYRAPVFSYLVRCSVAPDDRDDLFQDIFIRVHRAAASYDSERPLHPWLFTIVANTVRNHLRRQRVRSIVGAVDEVAEPAAGSPGAERVAAGRQTMAWLEQQIEKLPLARREVLILSCVENMPLRQIAGVLDLPLGTVKTHLRRARLNLAEELARRNAAEVSP